MSEKNKSNLLKRGLLISKTLIFRALMGRSKSIIGHPVRYWKLIKRATKKIQKYNGVGDFTSSAVASVTLLIQMLRAWGKGEYKGISTGKVMLVVAAILYFISPIDIVPDFIPVVGIMDDVSILVWVFSTMSKEVEEFVAWKNDQTSADTSELTYQQLYQMAAEKDISGRSKMNKLQLQAALAESNA